MQYKFKMYFLFAASIFVFGACTKQDLYQNFKKEPMKVDESKVFYKPQTQEEKQLVDNLTKLTDVLKNVYTNKSNVLLVNAAVYAKVYTDESVLIKDLIFPHQSKLSNSMRFMYAVSKHKLSLSQFAADFWKVVEKKNDASFKTFLNKLKPENQSLNTKQTDNYFNDNSYKVSVYFPYHEDFTDETFSESPSIVSITTATADANEAIGQIPVYDMYGNLFRYDQILVNDEYASKNPTHIIGLNGVDPYEYKIQLDSITPPPPPLLLDINRVYIGEGICKEQYDRLISFTGNGGGSEIKYCHLTGYLQPVNGHVTSFQDIVSVDFSRKEIRNKEWKRTMVVWDDNWELNDKEQVLAIYEEDNTNTRSFNGTLKTTLSLLGTPVEASIGYTVSVQSQDDIIRQLKISRYSYFGSAFKDQGQGFTKDRTFIPSNRPDLKWPAYDVHYDLRIGANVGWTWPYGEF